MENKPFIICISGKAEHGKTTFGTMLHGLLPNSLMLNYGDLVKYFCNSFFGWDGVKDENGRHMLQYVGTDLVRQQNPNYWVDFVLSAINLLKEKYDYFILCDTRFPNEIIGTHIRVVRPGYVSHLNEEQLKHPSETALDDVGANFIVKNCGSLKDLQKDAEVLSECLRGMREHENG